MNLIEACRHCDSLFRNPRQCIREVLVEAPQTHTTLDLFFRLHLPLCLTLPFGTLLSPYAHMQENFPWIHVVLPFALCCVCFFFSTIYDRIVENLWPRLISQSMGVIPIRNVAFYTHLPIGGVAFFFFFNSTLGYCVLFLFAFLANLFSIEYSSSTHAITRARALTYWLMSVAFVFFILLIFFFALALFRSYKVFL